MVLIPEFICLSLNVVLTLVPHRPYTQPCLAAAHRAGRRAMNGELIHLCRRCKLRKSQSKPKNQQNHRGFS